MLMDLTPLSVRAERERAEAAAELAAARHDAARIRHVAPAQDAAAGAAERAEGHRARDAILAGGRARIEAHCASAEAELRMAVSELASNLASRALDEHPARPAPDPA